MKQQWKKYRKPLLLIMAFTAVLMAFLIAVTSW